MSKNKKYDLTFILNPSFNKNQIKFEIVLNKKEMESAAQVSEKYQPMYEKSQTAVDGWINLINQPDWTVYSKKEDSCMMVTSPNL